MRNPVPSGPFGSRRKGQFAERFAKIEASAGSASAERKADRELRPNNPTPKAATASAARPTPVQPAAETAGTHNRGPQTENRSAAPLASPSAKSPVNPVANRPAAPSASQAAPSTAAASSCAGPAVQAATGENADPIGHVRAVMRESLIPVLVFSVVINLLMLTGPVFMLQVYDRALPSGNVPTLVILFVLVTILYAFFALLEATRGRIFIRLGTRIDELLHKPVYKALLRLTGRDPVGAGPQPLRDLDTVRSYVSGTGPAVFFDMPWVPIYLALIFVLHPLLGIFSIIAAAILVTVAILNKRLTQQGHGEVARATFEAHRFAEEARRDAPAAQALGMQTALVDEWTRRKSRSIGVMRGVADRSGLFASASKSMRLYFQSAMLALGAWLAIQQAITPGMIIAATIIMSRALAPIEQAIQQWQAFTGAQRAWGRLNELFAKAPIQPARRTALPAPTGAIQVANLACFVPNAARPMLAGIDFELDPGAGLGIIGPSGVGKSTLVKAILGIWPNISGDVRFDGAEHGQWDPAVLGRHMGYLPQEAILLPGTIAQNIARFDPDARSQAILHAGQITGAHQLAVSLPDGYDTVVGVDGVQLSSGQAQRIALARAVYGMPRIVVLDEPYSNLDTDGEHALHQTIATMREHGSTVIVVTHRSSALNALNTILCLREGRQAFYGPKDDVLRAMTRAVQGGAEADEAPRRVENSPQQGQRESAVRPPATKEQLAPRNSVVAMQPISSGDAKQQAVVTPAAQMPTEQKPTGHHEGASAVSGQASRTPPPPISHAARERSVQPPVIRTPAAGSATQAVEAGQRAASLQANPTQARPVPTAPNPVQPGPVQNRSGQLAAESDVAARAAADRMRLAEIRQKQEERRQQELMQAQQNGSAAGKAMHG